MACDVTGPIAYHFKDGANPFWTAIQLRNGRYPVATLWDGGVVRELKITATTKVVLDCPDVELGGEGGAPLARVGDTVDVLLDPVAIAAATQTGGIASSVGIISTGGERVKAL